MLPFVPCTRTQIPFGQPSIYERQQGLIQSAQRLIQENSILDRGESILQEAWDHLERLENSQPQQQEGFPQSGVQSGILTTLQIPGLAPTAPMHSHSTRNGGPTNGHSQQYPQGNNAPRNRESSTNGQRQQQPPNHTNLGQRGTALPDSQHQPRGDNAHQNEENGRVISVTPRRPPLDQVVRRLSQIAEDQEDGASSNGTTSPSYVLTAQNSVEGSSNGLPENNAQENNAHQNGAVPPDMPINPPLG